MKISPVSGPVIAQSENTQPTATQQAAKARAIAMLSGAATSNAQEHPVPNPTSISPEDQIKAPVQASEEAPTEGQSATSSEAEKPAPAATLARKEEPLSAQYAQLARKEKVLRSKVQELKATEMSLKAREEALKAKESGVETADSIKDKLARNPLATLQELGISYEQLTNAVLNQPSQGDQQILELKAEIEALKKGQESSQKSYQENLERQYNQAVSEIRKEVKQLVKTDDAFETIRGTDSVEDVVELIKQTYDKDGILLTAEEAAQEIEDYLLEEAIKLAKLKKVQSRLAPKTSAAPKQQLTQAGAQKQAPQTVTMKTLTNSVGVSRPLSAKERAILAFKGELRK